MAEDYTPTTDEITRYYIDGSRDWFPGLTASERSERFDRWLAEVRREAAEKAWDEGREAEELSWKHVFDGHPVPEGEMCDECAAVNPYRAAMGQGVTAATGDCGVTWDVRERASEYAGLHRCALPAGHGGPHVEGTHGWRWSRAAVRSGEQGGEA